MSEPTALLAVRGPIWLSALLYFSAVCLRCTGPAARPGQGYRRLWVLACAAYLAHAVAAFALYHGWSHTRALEHAARRTYEVTGWCWSGGVYVNYAFTVLWLADASVLAVAPGLHALTPRWLARLWLAATLFMFFQGLVVFGQGTSRTLGTAGLFASGAAWLWKRRLRAGASRALRAA